MDEDGSRVRYYDYVRDISGTRTATSFNVISYHNNIAEHFREQSFDEPFFKVYQRANREAIDRLDPLIKLKEIKVKCTGQEKASIDG